MPISPSQPSERRQPATARIGALATLPVFFDLNGKPVLLIGGSNSATWKAELLAATGARVEVHSTEFCDEMRSIAARRDLNGSIMLVEQPWSINVFSGKSLIIGDAETEAEAKAIYCAARAAGIPVNVIDKPAYCTFKFGTIVNRSPVVIGISTDGAAPVLGQAIRTRIEALLPQSLSQWAVYAKEIRETVLQKFSAGQQRRAFWAQFAQMAFGPFVRREAWEKPAEAKACFGAGSVTVLSVPSSDPGRLTLNDVRQLQTADAIYFEPNVDPAILGHARREAVRYEMTRLAKSSASVQQHVDHIKHSATNGENILLVKSIYGKPNTMLRYILRSLEASSVAILYVGNSLKSLGLPNQGPKALQASQYENALHS